MKKIKWIKVRFPGHGIFWIHKDIKYGWGTPLAFEHQVVNGELVASDNTIAEGSYAHLLRNDIMRNREKIGEFTDLELIND
jgi:hypothetical protein